MSVNTFDKSDGRNLPGFNKKSFSLPYNGGDIWFEHLDGIYWNDDLVLEKLKNDIKVFNKPSAPSHIAFVLNETTITDDIICLIKKALVEKEKRFFKVAFIDVNFRSKLKLRKSFKNMGFEVRFFAGSEAAKEWLL